MRKRDECRRIFQEASTCCKSVVWWSDGWLPLPKLSPEHRDKGSLSFHPSYLQWVWLQMQKGDPSIKGKSHLNESEVTADDSVLLPGIIHLSSIGLGGREKGRG